MSELEKNIIQRSLSSTQATSVLCLFMVPIHCLLTFVNKLLSAITGHFYAFAGAGAAAGAGPPVVGLGRWGNVHQHII